MATALNDIKDALRAHGFTDMLDSDMEALINDAYFDVCSRMPWPFLEKSATVNIVSGTTAVAGAPTDLGAVNNFTIDSVSTVLVPLRTDDFRKKNVGMYTTTGQPQYYYFVADALNVWPVPDANYIAQMDYIAIPTTLTNNTPGTTDIPLIPDRHRRVILLGALVSANAMEDDTDLAGWFEQQFQTRLQTMQNDLWKKQYDRPDMLYSINDSYDNIWE